MTKFGVVGIFVKYLLYFRCHRKNNLTGLFVAFSCLMTQETQLFSWDGDLLLPIIRFYTMSPTGSTQSRRF